LGTIKEKVGEPSLTTTSSNDASNGASVPRLLPHYLSRKRLLHVLEQTRSPLIIVRAPGGAGKTSLIVDWLRGSVSVRRTVWVGLDETAHSRDGFWDRVVRALIVNGVVKPDGHLADVLSGYVDPSRVAGLLLDELTAGAVSLRLVFDDLHLTAEAAIADVIWLLLNASDLQVVVTTRQRLALERPDVIARLEPVVVRGKELAFDVGETATLISRANTGLTEADADAIHASTGGHPLATRIAIASFAQSANGISIPIDQSTVVSHVATHAAEELLPRFQDESARLVALHISVVPSVDPELARELTGRDDAQVILRDFERNGYGEFQEIDGSLVFAFHSLVCAALEREAEHTLNAADLMGLRRAAARHLAVSANPLGAARLFARIGDDRELWKVLARNWSDIINHHVAELREIYRAIAQERILAEPTLAIGLAIALSEREPVPSAYSQKLVETALFQLAALEEPDPAERFWNLLAVFAGLRVIRRYAEDAEAGAVLKEHLDAMTAANRAHIGGAIAVVLIQMAFTDILLGRFDDALGVLQDLTDDVHQSRNQHRLSMTAEIQAIRGDMPDARTALEGVTQARVETWRASVPAIGWYLAETISRLEHNRPTDAVRLISDLDSQLQGAEQWPYLLWVKGLARLATNETERGLDELTTAIPKNRRRDASGFALDLLNSLRADLMLATGARESARRVLRGRQSNSTPLILARVRLSLADDRAGDAKSLLSSILQGEEATPRQLAEALLLHAIGESRLGYLENARRAVHRAFSLLETHGLSLPLVMVPHGELLPLIDDPARRAMLEGLADPFGFALSPVALSDAERAVMTMLASTETVAVAAQRLYLSINTVKSHLRRIYRKLGVSSREAAVSAARQRGLLDRP
jgi:LuxR family maltose regulon positive regulatory protein